MSRKRQKFLSVAAMPPHLSTVDMDVVLFSAERGTKFMRDREIMELPALKVGKPRPTPVVRGGITAIYPIGIILKI